MTFIAAEIGVNFRDFREVKRMIGLAGDAGADGVKFQCYREEHIKGHPREAELIDIILKQTDIEFLKDTADGNGIEFFATPMYPEAVDMLEAVRVKKYKIRYADNNNETLISRVAQTGKEMYVSCGYQYIDNMDLEVWHDDYRKWTFVYCVPEYPPKTVDLPKKFRKFDGKFGGYSNHYPSISIPLAAAARGAEYIEVHVKNDKYHEGYKPIDDAASITFSELEQLVKLTREIEKIVR